MKSSNQPLVALIGNPNAGKTTVFNALLGFRQKTANYPGATVDLKEGQLILNKELTVRVLDLPGLYSLQATSLDEQIALDVILGKSQSYQKPDLILNIIDVSNLKRNLLLYSQLVDTGLPILLVLTMSDLLAHKKQSLDLKALQNELGLNVIQMPVKAAAKIPDLKTAILKSLHSPIYPKPKVILSKEFEKAITEIQTTFSSEHLDRFTISNLLAGESTSDHSDKLINKTKLVTEQLKTEHNWHPALLSLKRYKWIDQLLDKVLTKPKNTTPESLTHKIDRVLTHKFWGLTIFSLIMFIVFQSIYTGAGPVMEGIDFLFNQLSQLVASNLENYPVLQSLLADGIITGVGSVVIFLPQILLLFLFIALLEDSGYMSRAAFLMDRLLGWAGLNGRAFIPMLSSFACAVPGVMAARVMPNARARLTTILVAPLMSCSARLPVYILLIGALIEPQFGAIWAAVCLFFFHLLGLLVALPVAFILNRGVLKTPSIPFLLEMPTYRVPDLRSVILRVYDSGKRFLIQAGTIIFAMSVLIWAMSYFPRPASIEEEIRAGHAEELGFAQLNVNRAAMVKRKIDNKIASRYLEQSYLGRLGEVLLPIFKPLGFNWKITVGIIGAFPAREVIISTLGIIYNVGEVDEVSSSLRQSILRDRHPNGKKVFTPLVAISLMIFFALCSQCMSTLATVYRELKSWKWTAFLFGYMTTLAYIFALLVYQGGKYLGFE